MVQTPHENTNMWYLHSYPAYPIYKYSLFFLSYKETVAIIGIPFLFNVQFDIILRTKKLDYTLNICYLL
jgi:hypothetical protein